MLAPTDCDTRDCGPFGIRMLYGNPGVPGIYSDAQIAGWRGVVDAVFTEEDKHRQDAIAVPG